MDILEIMEKRHSVRQYEDTPLTEDVKNQLKSYLSLLNERYNTQSVVFFDDADGFKNAERDYGNFAGCKNYAVFIGEDAEVCGYEGELFALKAQSLFINSCFVALTYDRAAVKSKVTLNGKNKIQCSMALGYGVTQGAAHKNKPIEKLVSLKGEKPDNYDRIVKACLLAPTAINQQKFKIVFDNGKVFIKKRGLGFYTDFDLGIVKAHLDLAVGKITL